MAWEGCPRCRFKPRLKPAFSEQPYSGCHETPSLGLVLSPGKTPTPQRLVTGAVLLHHVGSSTGTGQRPPRKSVLHQCPTGAMDLRGASARTLSGTRLRVGQIQSLPWQLPRVLCSRCPRGRGRKLPAPHHRRSRTHHTTAATSAQQARLCVRAAQSLTALGMWSFSSCSQGGPQRRPVGRCGVVMVYNRTPPRLVVEFEYRHRLHQFLRL